MLRADQIELAILNLLVDYNDSSGRTFRIPILQSWLMPTIGDTSDREVIDSLMFLFENDIIAIERYMGMVGYVSYELSHGTTYFYGPDIRCRAKQKARRRQQELARGNRHGIFISHISPEAPVALHLKKLLLASLSPAVPVFVSSDYDSIPSGEWYPAILKGLRNSTVVLSVLSPASLEKRWINFEAGFGMGAEAEVIPLVWGGLERGDIGMPLGQLQARALNDPKAMKALLDILATWCKVAANFDALTSFLGELPAIEAKVPTAELAVRLFRVGGTVRMSIQNMGTRQLELAEAELLMPQQLSANNNFQEYQPVRQPRYANHDGVKFVGNALTIHASNFLHLGVNPLTLFLTAQMGEYIIAGLGACLPPNLTDEQMRLPIHYAVQSKQLCVGPVLVPISEIPFREQS